MLSLHQTSVQPNKNLPPEKVFAFIIIGLLFIGIVIVTILNSRDAIDRVSDEERLQVLDAMYGEGKEFSENEFKTYCDLLEKIWKKHLPACYCRDGIENPTPGIDWTNPPKSPESLGSAWIDVTDPRMEENNDRNLFINKDNGQKVTYDIKSKRKNREFKQKHWHRFNPNSTGDKDLYLDECGKSTGKGSANSHIWIKELESYGR